MPLLFAPVERMVLRVSSSGDVQELHCVLGEDGQDRWNELLLQGVLLEHLPRRWRGRRAGAV